MLGRRDGSRPEERHADPVDLLAAAALTFERVVVAVPADAWDNDTPCGISVREVIDHVVAGNLFGAMLLTGVPLAIARPVLEGDHLGAEPVQAVVASCARQNAAFAATGPAFLVPHPSGDLSVQTFLRFRVGDLAVHAWDVARGAGLDETLPPPLVSGLWEMVAPHLDDMRAMGTFGEGASQDLPRDTPLQARLLDAFGRS